MRKKAEAIFVGLVICAAMVALATPSAGFVSEEEAFYSTVLDVYLPCDTTVQLYPIYDKTTIKVDFSNDGIYDETYEKDQLKKIELSLLCGAHIHADKPVMAMRKIKKDKYTSAYIFGNPNQFSTDYYVPHGQVAVISPLYPDTTVQIDKNNDGIWDSTKKLVFNIPYIPSVQVGSKIRSTKPVQVLYYSHSDVSKFDGIDVASVPPFGYEYITPWEDMPLRVIATKDFTTVDIDTNTDGSPDITFELNAGKTKDLSSIPSGSKIYSAKPILVCSYVMNWRYYDIYQSANSYGTDYWIPSGLGVNLFAIDAGTIVSVDTDFDGVYEYTINLTKRTTESVAIGHVHANKPIMVFRRSYDAGDSSYMYTHPTPTVSTSLDFSPSELGTDEIVTSIVNIVNPVNATLKNVSVVGYIPYGFKFLKPSTITVNLKKTNMNTDLQTATDTATITIEDTGTKYKYSIDAGDCSILKTLERDLKLEIGYQITTPDSVGTYTFDPVTVRYSADTYKIESITPL